MYVFLEHSRKEIVVSIRGTLETQDILTDLMCTSVALDTECAVALLLFPF